jgi:hypothetical protein
MISQIGRSIRWMDCSCNTIDGGMTHQPEEAFVFHVISSRIPRQAKVSVPATSHDGVSCYKYRDRRNPGELANCCDTA